MIELNFGKLLLVAVIALIVLGPEKLPKAARMAGAMVRRLRLGWESVRTEVERELEVEEIRRAAREAVERADAARGAATGDLKAATTELNDTVAQVAKTTHDVVRGTGTRGPHGGGA